MSGIAKRLMVRKHIRVLALVGLLGLVLVNFACGDSSPDRNSANHTEPTADAQQGVGTGVVLDPSPAAEPGPSVDTTASTSSEGPTCDPSMVDCRGRCVDLTMDHDNCGACTLACAASGVCYLGQCTQTCPAGTTQCGGGCADLQSDLHHCGGCSMVDAGSFACESNQMCRRGRCASGCDAPLVICFGKCIDPMTNPIFCGISAGCNLADSGTSGTTCAQGQACSGGVCQSACEVGQTRCPDGACRHLMTDNDNCGMCGSECASDKKCMSGVCTCIVPGTCPS
jgi:hypothetical protein